MEIKTTVKYPTGIATSQKTERLSIGKVGEQVQLSYTSRGKRKWYHDFVKELSSFLIHIYHLTPPLGIYTREIKTLKNK